MNGNAVLEMRRRQAITGGNAPLVFQQGDVALPHGYHWFDGYAEPIVYLLARTLSPIVGNSWVFVHGTAYTMPDELPHDSVSPALAMLLNRIPYIADAATWQRDLNALIKGFLCGLEQLSNLRFYFAYAECVAGISAKTVKTGTAID